jgi:Ca2+/Na+ antiporter
MAEKKKTQKNSKKTNRRRRTVKNAGTKTLTELFKRRKNRDAIDFKPDVQTATWSKTLRLTKLQQLRLTKWVLYALCVVMAVVVQDVVMSKFTFFGATTDLPASVILLITVIEGTEVGSLFVLISSTLYYFSGNAPFAAVIGLMSILGIAATLFRQMYWHRSKGSILLCAALALVGYELGLFAVGFSSQLTHWGRLPSFVLTALYSCLVQIPLYSLIYKIGLIGGNTWKE